MQARLVVVEHVCRNMPALHEAGAAAQSEQGAAPVAEKEPAAQLVAQAPPTSVNPEEQPQTAFEVDEQAVVTSWCGPLQAEQAAQVGCSTLGADVE
jgi:hypothetical protein